MFKHTYSSYHYWVYANHIFERTFLQRFVFDSWRLKTIRHRHAQSHYEILRCLKYKKCGAFQEFVRASRITWRTWNCGQLTFGLLNLQIKLEEVLWHMESLFDLTKYLLRANCVWKQGFRGYSEWENVNVVEGDEKCAYMQFLFHGYKYVSHFDHQLHAGTNFCFTVVWGKYNVVIALFLRILLWYLLLWWTIPLTIVSLVAFVLD